jgi:hypothetical protein
VVVVACERGGEGSGGRRGNNGGSRSGFVSWRCVSRVPEAAVLSRLLYRLCQRSNEWL